MPLLLLETWLNLHGLIADEQHCTVHSATKPLHAQNFYGCMAEMTRVEKAMLILMSLRPHWLAGRLDSTTCAVVAG